MSDEEIQKKIRKERIIEVIRKATKEGFSLVNIYTGEEKILQLIGTSEKERKEALKKEVKDGWIQKEIFEKHEDEIIEWVNTREVMNEKRSEIRSLEESIEGLESTLFHYRDKEYYKQMVPIVEEKLEKEKKELSKKQMVVYKVKPKYNMLNRKIRGLRIKALEKMKVI